MTSKKIYGKFYGTLAASLFLSVAATPSAQADKHDKKAGGEFYCSPSCKGASDCHGYGNAKCKGQNSCDGEGFIKAKDEAACKAKAGTWKEKPQSCDQGSKKLKKGEKC